MNLLADTHIHIYPCHDAARLISGAARRLSRFSSDADSVKVLFLTEAASCDYFRHLCDGSHGLPSTFKVESRDDRSVAVNFEGDRVWIIAGRQIVARERIEVLALGCREKIPDGGSATEVIRRVLQAGGVPVLAWAPGQWMFKRAAVVSLLLDEFGPEECLLGDSSLRATGWPEPEAMKRRRILAGSDPLPFPGEEEQAGGYGIRMSFQIDENRPADSLCAALLNPLIPLKRVGSRNTPWGMIHRMMVHRQYKRIER